MFKIRILKDCRLAVINDENKEVIANCKKDDEAYVDKLYNEDIQSGLYVTYKNQVDTSSTRIRERQEEPVKKENNQITEAVGLLKSAVDNATKVISVLSTQQNTNPESKIVIADKNGNVEEVPEEPVIEERKEPEKPYTAQNYTDHHARIRNMLKNNLIEEDDEHPRELKADIMKQRLPKFAALAPDFKSEGEIRVGKIILPENSNLDVTVTKDINGKESVNIN